MGIFDRTRQLPHRPSSHKWLIHRRVEYNNHHGGGGSSFHATVEFQVMISPDEFFAKHHNSMDTG